MQHPTRKVGSAYYAAAADADKMPVLALALISAVLSAVAFLVAAGLAGVIRFSPDPERADEAAELPAYLSEPAGGDHPAPESPKWREQHEKKKAKLEAEIQRLNREIESTRARAEKDRRELEKLVDDLNRRSARDP